MSADEPPGRQLYFGDWVVALYTTELSTIASRNMTKHSKPNSDIRTRGFPEEKLHLKRSIDLGMEDASQFWSPIGRRQHELYVRQ